MHTPKLFVQNIPQNTCKWHFNCIYLHWSIMKNMFLMNHENTHITCI